MNNNIFSIGDVVIDNCGNKGKITGFQQDKFDKSKLIVEFGTSWRRHLKNIQHAKQPIFTTEDGVDIYEGDKYCYVVETSFQLYPDQRATKCSGNRHKCLYFSTKEKAKEWIDENKPKYSLNDIRKCMVSVKSKNSGLHDLPKFWEKLKQLHSD